MTLLNDKRIFGLDIMRALAILMVLLGHCTWILPQNNGILTTLLAFSGYFGVEVFFVLSGFLIGRILYQQFTTTDFNPGIVIRFLKRRWFRTLPNYYLVLLLNVLIAFIIGYPIDDFWRYLVFAQNFASPMHAFFPESWSLSVEEFCYVLVPIILLMFAAIKKNRNRIRQFIVVVLLLILLCLLIKYNYHLANPDNTMVPWNIGLRMVVIYRFDAILIGIVFSWLYSKYHSLWMQMKLPLALFGFFMIGFFLFGIGKFQLLIEHYPLFWDVFYLPLTSITIAFFLPVLSEWKSERGLAARAITFISIISYSIYLLHYGVVLQLMKHFLTLGTGSIEQLTGFIIIYFFLTFALSWLLYRYYESKMTRLRDRN